MELIKLQSFTKIKYKAIMLSHLNFFYILLWFLFFFNWKNLDNFSIYACRPCAGTMSIFSISFQFYRMTQKGLVSYCFTQLLCIIIIIDHEIICIWTAMIQCPLCYVGDIYQILLNCYSLLWVGLFLVRAIFFIYFWTSTFVFLI